MRHSLMALSLGCVLVFTNLAAQQFGPAVYSLKNLQFNYNLPSARAVGLGGAFISIADDATASEANPAGLTALTLPEVATHLRFNNFSHSEIAGTSSNPDRRADFTDNVFSLPYLSFVYPFPDKRVSLAFFRQEFVNFKSSYEVNGFVPSGGDFGAIGTISCMDVKVVNWGGAIAVSPNPVLSMGFAVRVSVADYTADERQFLDVPDYLSRPAGFVGDDVRANIPENQISNNQLLAENEMGFGFVAGAIVKPVDFFSLGAVYRYNPKLSMTQILTNSAIVNESGGPFNAYLAPPSGLSRAFDLKLPDMFGVGVSVTPAESFTLSLDAVRIRYSDLLGEIPEALLNISLDDDPTDPDGVVDQKISDVTEIHFGAEYSIPLRNAVLSIRGGYYLEPEHNIYYTGTNRDLLRALPRGEDGNHLTAGMGLVLRENQIQLDWALNISEQNKEFIVSTVFRF